MLTDMTEAEFDLKEEEPWYDHQDLEHDLHLAAELGKNLLEQNRDLEQTLQQMHETNQEQLQEIEYLSKQVDLLRSVNDQHAKVYEQLDSTSRDLELKNQRLVLENRAAQVKIDGLTETVDGLQTQVEELQRDVKKLKQSRSDPDAPRHDDVQGLTCCKQKCQLNKYFSHERSIPCSLKREEPDEELLRSTRSLRARLRTERAQREAAEREADALAQELGELEPKAALLGVYERRLAETEAEVEELRLLLRSSKNNLSLLDEEVGVASHRGWSLHSCSGERRRGISLLNEMDEQYVALKEQHDALLRRCEERASNPASQPAYKTLFHELFTFIQKSKEELKENRTKPVQVE